MRTDTPQPLSKLEIIERHLSASIQMIALELNPISTHVIVMACEEMVLSLADAKGILLDFDYRSYIEDEFHKEYRKKIRNPYNFFKHADEDPHDIYDGPPEHDLRTVNEIVTLMNASGYRSLGGNNFRAALNLFAATLLYRSPRLFKAEWIASQPELKELIEKLKGSPHAYAALRLHLHELGMLPRIPL